MNETKWKRHTWLWLIKAVGNAMSVFIFPYFGARSSCDWEKVLAFLPDICSSVVVNMNIILKLSMCLCVKMSWWELKRETMTVLKYITLVKGVIYFRIGCNLVFVWAKQNIALTGLTLDPIADLKASHTKSSKWFWLAKQSDCGLEPKRFVWVQFHQKVVLFLCIRLH